MQIVGFLRNDSKDFTHHTLQLGNVPGRAISSLYFSATWHRAHPAQAAAHPQLQWTGTMPLNQPCRPNHFRQGCARYFLLARKPRRNKERALIPINISLPDPLKAYVEDRVASGDFGTPSEFVRNLIRQDKEQRRSRLESELLDALQTKELTITSEELNGRNLVSLLRDKLARP